MELISDLRSPALQQKDLVLHLPVSDQLGVHWLSQWPFARSFTASPVISAGTGWTLRISLATTGRSDDFCRFMSHSEAIHPHDETVGRCGFGPLELANAKEGEDT